MTSRIGLSAAIAFLLCSSPLHAQSARTFLATTGNDSNPCSVAAPCRTLGAGIAAVASGGDVIILDSGGYGENITIAKSVTVVAQPGVVARLKTSTGFGVKINGSGISVTLNGLGVTGTGTEGVHFVAGDTLFLKNVDISMTSGGTGVSHEAPGGFLTMSGVTVRNAFYCVQVAPVGAGKASAMIVDSQAVDCRYPFFGSGNVSMTVERSIGSGSGTQCSTAFSANGTSGGATRLKLNQITATGCSTGLSPYGNGGTGTITVSNSVITNNAAAAAVGSSGVGFTYGNNVVIDNGTTGLTGFTSATPY